MSLENTQATAAGMRPDAESAARFEAAEAFISSVIADGSTAIPGVLVGHKATGDMMLPMTFSDEQEKALFLRIAHAVFLAKDVEAYTVISEVWIAQHDRDAVQAGDSIPAPSEDPNRTEGFMVLHRTRDLCRMRVYSIERKDDDDINGFTLSQEHVSREADGSFGGAMANLLEASPSRDKKTAANLFLMVASQAGLIDLGMLDQDERTLN